MYPGMVLSTRALPVSASMYASTHCRQRVEEEEVGDEEEGDEGEEGEEGEGRRGRRKRRRGTRKRRKRRRWRRGTATQ